MASAKWRHPTPIGASDLPRSEVLDCSIIADAFGDDSNDFEKANEDVFIPSGIKLRRFDVSPLK